MVRAGFLFTLKGSALVAKISDGLGRYILSSELTSSGITSGGRSLALVHLNKIGTFLKLCPIHTRNDAFTVIGSEFNDSLFVITSSQ